MSFKRLIAVLKAAPLELTQGMSTATWMTIPPTKVRLENLTFTQPHLDLETMKQPDPNGYAGDMYPHVVDHNGELIVDDGHNRLMHRLIRGRKTAKARVLKR